MENLKNKKYNQFAYTSRYTSVPYFYDTIAKREVYGIGTQMSKDTPWVAHKIKQGDTLESLSLKYYNNPTYWWIIAYFNDIIDPFIDLWTKYNMIKIPSITSIAFENER